MDKFKSKLIFNKYIVKEIKFKYNENFKEKPVEILFNISKNIKYENNKKAAPRAARARRNPGSARRRDSRRSRRRVFRRVRVQRENDGKELRGRHTAGGLPQMPVLRREDKHNAQYPRT